MKKRTSKVFMMLAHSSSHSTNIKQYQIITISKFSKLRIYKSLHAKLYRHRN